MQPGPNLDMLSPALRARFDAMIAHYPVKRSALVPMLLYAQDELGHLTPEVIRGIAARLELDELAVREVIGYYSMLRLHPAGRYHVQVCTNISCMLRGAYDVFDHLQEKLGIGHKGVTADGVFSLEEVECIGACCWAPAMQVNYDFHDELTNEKVDAVLADYRARSQGGVR